MSSNHGGGSDLGFYGPARRAKSYLAAYRGRMFAWRGLRCGPHLFLAVFLLAAYSAMVGCATTTPVDSLAASSNSLTPTISVSLKQDPPSILLVDATAVVSATVNNDPASAGVDWVAACGSAPNCGSFSPAHTAAGALTVFTAPIGVPSGNTVVVTALSTTDHSKSASATVTIMSTVTGVTITQAPPPVVPAGGTVTVAATVAGDPSNAGVDWTATCGGINCTSGFNAGTHSAPGAPLTFVVPLPSVEFPNIVGGTVTLTALATADHAFSATAAFTVAGPVTLSITQPPPATVSTGATATVSAVVTNDPTNAGVTWTILSCAAAPCGSWSATSVVFKTQVASGATVTYYAPTTAVSNVVLQAASTASPTTTGAFATVTLSVTAPISITLTEGVPNNSMVEGTSRPLSATVANDTNAEGVDWTVTCGNPGACGSFSPVHTASGAATTYTAPAAVPTNNTVTITATSTADPTKSASSTVTVTATVNPDTLLSGQWILLLSGRDANGGPYALGGAIDGGGAGNITGGALDLTDLGGGPGFYNAGFVSVKPTSTYSIGSDGRGQIQLAMDTSSLNGNFGVSGNGSIVVSAVFVSPTHALLSETDAFGTGTGTLDLQNSSDLAAFQSGTSGPSGMYSLRFMGAEAADPAAKYFVTGALGFKSSGTSYTETSYIADLSDDGVITTVAAQTTAQGFNNPVPSAYGEMAFNSLNLGLPTKFNLDAWMIDANHFAVTDLQDVFFGTPPVIVSGYMVAQPASGGDVSGTYAFVENGETASPSFVPMAAGGIITCGSTGTLDFSSLGGTPVNNQAINVLCAAPASGRGKISLLNTGGTGITRFSAYPTVDQGLFLMELDGGSAGASGPSGFGVAEPQTLTAPIAVSAFSGKYASNFLATTSEGFEAFAGQVDSDGVSALSGTADVNSFNNSTPPLGVGTPSSNAVLGGSFTAGSNGKFPLALTITPATGQPAPEYNQINPACYIVDASTCLLFGSDQTAPGTGILELQNTGL